MWRSISPKDWEEYSGYEKSEVIAHYRIENHFAALEYEENFPMGN